MKKCPFCTDRYKEETDMITHLQEEHEEMIPKDFSSDQMSYFIKTGKMHGNCLMCKENTPWNDATGKYSRLCTKPKCKEEYSELFKKRMMGKYGKTTLLSDPNHQKKMLANRSISGEYEWTDGTKIPYTGSYELDFLKFLDQFMGFPSNDIIAPSPHTYYYTYDGKRLFYMPDFFIPSLNLEIEIKAGGKNENNHHKIQAVDRVKEKLKDEVLRSQKEFSYVKVFDKEYDNFIDLLMKMKHTDKPLFYTKDWNAVSESTVVTEGNIPSSGLFHVSRSNLDGRSLTPRIPNNYMVKNGYEDGRTPRVSFAKKINGCLMAIHDISVGDILYVHEPAHSVDAYTPSTNQVPDVKITNEVWVKTNVRLKCVGAIKITDEKGDGITYKYGDGKQAKLYDWEWKQVPMNTTVAKEALEDAVYSLYSNSPDVIEESLNNLKQVVDCGLQNELISTMENHINYYRTSSDLMNIIRRHDTLNQDSLTDIYDLGSQSKFGFYHPGFINKDIEYYTDELIKSSLQGTFRDSVLNKVTESNINRENLIRDLHLAKQVMVEHAKTHPEDLNKVIETYNWVDKVILENVVTIGSTKMYPVYILLTHTGTVLSNVIKKFTGKEFSHCSISLDPELDNMYSFGRKFKSNPLIGTFVKEDINSGLFEDVKEKASYALYVTYVTKEDYDAIQERLEYFKNNPEGFRYNFTGLLSHAVGRESSRYMAYFCSQFVDTILSSGHNYFDKHSSLVKPTDFAEHEDFHFISTGLLKDYDNKDTKNKTMLIASSLKSKPKVEIKTLLYIPLTSDSIGKGYHEVGPDVIGYHTSYSAMKKDMREFDRPERFYTVVPVKNIERLVVGSDDKYIYVQGPFGFKINNKNII